MHVLLVAQRLLRELLREPILWGLTLLFPVFFFFLALAAYSHDPLPKTWVVDLDPAVERRVPGLGAALLALRHDDGRPAFIRAADARDGQGKPKKVDLTVQPDAQDGAGAQDLQLQGDALSPDYVAASNALEVALERVVGREQPRQTWGVVRARPPFRNPASEFEAFAPGMMIFAVLLLVPQTAVQVGREVRRGTVRRMLLAGVQGRAYLGGVTLAQSVCAVALGLILLGLAALSGFPFTSEPAFTAAVVLASLVVLGVASVAQGLVLAVFLRSDAAATNWGSVVCMTQVFLSGAFFGLPAPTLWTLGQPGQPGFWALGAYDFFPATHAMRALQRVASAAGEGLGEPLLAMALLSSAYLALAVVVFNRRALRDG